jgi:hypothetical protein
VPLLDGACSLDPYEADQCAWPTLPGVDANRRSRRNALACDRWLWSNAEIPFVNQLDDDSITENLLAAMRRIERVSCVRFREAGPKDRKFLTVKQSRPLAGERCRATAGTDPKLLAALACYYCVLLGAMPRFPQLRLSSACTQGQMLHELFHVLGFAHEHSRPDRDNFIRINCANIARNLTQNFRRLKSETVHTFDVPYDFYSIMHYRLDHFSDNGLPTIEPLNQHELNYDLIGLMKVLSQGDIRRLNLLYKC